MGILNVLAAVQDESFLCLLEKLQGMHDSGKGIGHKTIIRKANIKHLKLVSRKKHKCASKKFINLATEEQDVESKQSKE